MGDEAVDDGAPYLAALTEHRISLQRCDACGRHRFPPMPACPWCGAETSTRHDVSGRGRVYSWVTVHRALTPAMAGEEPYTIATVTLDEGCRIFGRLVAPEPVAADDPVEAVFVDHDGGTELRFRVVGVEASP